MSFTLNTLEIRVPNQGMEGDMLPRDSTAKVSLEESWDGSHLEAILPLWGHSGMSGDIFT